MSTPKKSRKKPPAKPKKEKQNRIDFENNQDLISSEFFKLISKNGKMPTITKLAESTGLSYKTVERHIKAPSFKNMKEKLRAFNDMMLVQFAQKVSKSSNPGMWDMYWTLTEPEYMESKNKKTVDVTSKGQSVTPVIVLPSEK